jgi:hypothetical protein
MNDRLMFSGLLLLTVMLAGCKTLDPEPKTLSWNTERIYLKKLRDPRIFGLGIYQTPSGQVEIRGGGRLHPNQGEIFEMEAEAPFRPVAKLSGNLGEDWPILLDVSSRKSWLDFEVAKKLRAVPLGEGKPNLVSLPGEDVRACLSTVSALRMRQISIETPLVYVRLATGSMGPLTRGIDDQGLKGVIGWDILRKFEQIRFLYSEGRIALLTSEVYEPNPATLIASLPIVEHAGACVVYGLVDGAEGPILIDPVGDFELAVPGGSRVQQVSLGDALVFEKPEISESPGGVRIGARLLQKYQLTLAPASGKVYFESAVSEN